MARTLNVENTLACWGKHSSGQPAMDCRICAQQVECRLFWQFLNKLSDAEAPADTQE